MTTLTRIEPGSMLTSFADLDDRFWTFHVANPHVYDELVRLARELRVSGHSRTSLRLLLYVVRYNAMLQTDRGDSPFKIDQKHGKRYAKLIMLQEPDLRGFFKLKGEGSE